MFPGTRGAIIVKLQQLNALDTQELLPKPMGIGAAFQILLLTSLCGWLLSFQNYRFEDQLCEGQQNQGRLTSGIP